ncbi:hypothetical protein BBW65_06525 [Helicobacter enhydrae]|uniref:Uncharacterized protein n=1 Tax=Helicobacter enhydrae TaxID=222136 RepID=A0A1B1U700_9HELI|nr:hypothetical protein BBW65_06525 [Helicobacter enhydrae]
MLCSSQLEKKTLRDSRIAKEQTSPSQTQKRFKSTLNCPQSHPFAKPRFKKKTSRDSRIAKHNHYHKISQNKIKF